ncbi:Uncharacterized protein BM_BM414 [Brugia malayi]|uniref:Bm414 n=1 Tax=Brugia malayi TaxID=6279 RepID=A0A0K0JDD0_BRUMA|nr:Uncharacterized protein BM_BM414 [Brugia malayi]CRZ23812.1 Bm414 [Brugia malayi]VIO86897.1 Uncharacterized protein BM_BM414 [Brugia malayi]
MHELDNDSCSNLIMAKGILMHYWGLISNRIVEVPTQISDLCWERRPYHVVIRLQCCYFNRVLNLQRSQTFTDGW